MSGEDTLREALAAAVASTGLRSPESAADALLPVVLRYGRDKAAEELRAAAENDLFEGARERILARANALTAEDPT